MKCTISKLPQSNLLNPRNKILQLRQLEHPEEITHLSDGNLQRICLLTLNFVPIPISSSLNEMAAAGETVGRGVEIVWSKNSSPQKCNFRTCPARRADPRLRGKSCGPNRFEDDGRARLGSP